VQKEFRQKESETGRANWNPMARDSSRETKKKCPKSHSESNILFKHGPFVPHPIWLGIEVVGLVGGLEGTKFDHWSLKVLVGIFEEKKRKKKVFEKKKSDNDEKNVVQNGKVLDLQETVEKWDLLYNRKRKKERKKKRKEKIGW